MATGGFDIYGFSQNTMPALANDLACQQFSKYVSDETMEVAAGAASAAAAAGIAAATVVILSILLLRLLLLRSVLLPLKLHMWLGILSSRPLLQHVLELLLLAHPF